MSKNKYLCYELDNKSRLIDSRIDELFKKGHKGELITAVYKGGKIVQGYDYLFVVDYLKLVPLQFLAVLGLHNSINEALDKGSDNDPELSDFDKRIQQALTFNLNK